MIGVTSRRLRRRRPWVVGSKSIRRAICTRSPYATSGPGGPFGSWARMPAGAVHNSRICVCTIRQPRAALIDVVSIGRIRPPAVSHDAFLRTRHFGSLDGVRCFSILAVVWHHTDHSWVGAAWAGRGFLGVDMFFVLSGFLIVTLILREKDRTGTISLKDFYVRRTLRIFPIYYGLLLVLAALYGISKPDDDDTRVLLDLLPY